MENDDNNNDNANDTDHDNDIDIRTDTDIEIDNNNEFDKETCVRSNLPFWTDRAAFWLRDFLN